MHLAAYSPLPPSPPSQKVPGSDVDEVGVLAGKELQPGDQTQEGVAEENLSLRRQLAELHGSVSHGDEVDSGQHNGGSDRLRVCICCELLCVVQATGESCSQSCRRRRRLSRPSNRRWTRLAAPGTAREGVTSVTAAGRVLFSATDRG